MKEYPENVDVCLIEGAVCNEDNLELLHKIRAAHQGARVLRRLRGDRQRAGHPQPARPGQRRERAAARLHRGRPDQPGVPEGAGIVPPLLERVMPVHEVVHVEYFLPGCPPPAARIKALVAQVLERRRRRSSKATQTQIWLNSCSCQNASSLTP